MSLTPKQQQRAREAWDSAWQGEYFIDRARFAVYTAGRQDGRAEALSEVFCDDPKRTEQINDAGGTVATDSADWVSGVGFLQARIDALMLEYCPDEMTPEQVENWGKHQRLAERDQTVKSLEGITSAALADRDMYMAKCTERDREVRELREMLTLVMSIPSMTDEQLVELKNNAQIAALRVKDRHD